MVAGGDGDSVDIFVFEKLANVLVCFLRLGAGQFFGEAHGALDLRLIDVAHSGDARFRQLRVAGDVVASAATYADDRDVDTVVGAKRGHAGCHGDGGGLNESSAIHSRMWVNLPRRNLRGCGTRG